MTRTINIMLDLETWGTKPGCDLRSIGACVFDPVTGFVHDGSLGTIRPFYQAVDNPTTTVGDPTHDQSHFDYESGEYRRYNLHRDPETVKWWAKQSDEANAAFANPIDLADGLRGFTNWLCTVTNVSDQGAPPNNAAIRLWAHGANFDPPILAAAYDACALPVPWHYRAPRDTRTIFDAAGIDDHTEWLKQHPGPLAIPHHALDDAICQARAVCAAIARLRAS